MAKKDGSIPFAFSIISGKWKLPVLWELNQHDSVRFNELQRNVTGISSVMLSKTLEELEHNHVVKRTQFNEIPPRVEYSMTDAGKGITPILRELGEWGKKLHET